MGHAWVKARFIDPMPPREELRTPQGSRVFLPARIEDNPFLTQSDPDYVKRLQNLGEREQKALLHGDWDIFEGQFFAEFERQVHVVKPFALPKHWKVYRALDAPVQADVAAAGAALQNGTVTARQLKTLLEGEKVSEGSAIATLMHAGLSEEAARALVAKSRYA